jgi:arylsulfatase A-like enzyme/Flp pilus assembly protein TadD
MRRNAPIALGLVVLTFAVYAGVASHEFVDYDDPTYITQNPNLAQGLGPDTLIRAFTVPYAANWIPVTWISLHVNHALHGVDPAGYLLTNVGLHALAAVLLYLALARMTGVRGPSAFVAAVFAVHPLHVESVAWASERKDVLAGAFSMATLVAYAFYTERRSKGRYASVLILLSLALLSKPTAVTLPLVLLLLDFWPLGRMGTPPDRDRFTSCLIEKLPMLALSALASAVTFAVQRSGGSMHLGLQLPFSWRLENAIQSLMVYAGKSFQPTGLAAFYPHPLGELAIWQTLVALAVLLGITWAALRNADSRPYLLVGWLWFVGTLIPVLGLVQVGEQARADRYTYIPLIGLAIAVAWSALDGVGSRRHAERGLALAGAVGVLLLGMAARVQVHTWRDTITLFEHAAAVVEENHFAHHRLGAAHFGAGRFEQAERHYRESLRIEPRQPSVRVELANLLATQGRLEEALVYYREAAELQPNDARAVAFLGDALVRARRLSEARSWLERALALYARDEAAGVPWTGPSRARLLSGLGQVHAAQGRSDVGLRHFEEAVRLDPHDPDVAAQLGLARVRAGRYADARPYVEQALRVQPDSAPLHAALAMVFAGLGQPEVAVRLNRRALELEPGMADAANNLAWLLATSPNPRVREPDEAIRLAELAVGVSDPPDPGRLDTLAAALASAGRFDEAARTAAEAVRLAEERGQAGLAAALREHEQLFRARQPYREDGGQDGAPAPRPESGLRGAIVFLLDTLRADRLSIYGADASTSPAIARLAERGVVFDNAISGAPWTLPSVVGLLAGDPPARAFARGRLQYSIVEAFRRAGFATAAFTEGGYLSQRFGLDLGFSHYVETRSAVQFLAPGEARTPDPPGSIARTFADATRWLERHAKEPFLLLVHTYETHTPYERLVFTEGHEDSALGDGFSIEEVEAVRAGELALDDRDLQVLGALYDGGVREADRYAGEMLTRLEALGIADETLVVVTSDHGEDLGDLYPMHAGDHGHSLHDALVRVPLVLFDPSASSRGRRIDAQVRLLDVLPTLAERLDVPTRAEAGGRSLVPLLRGDDAAPRLAVGGHTKVGPGRRFVRTEDFKYIEATNTEAGPPLTPAPPEVQLYDLRADPEEHVNLAGERPDLVRRFRRILAEASPDGGGPRLEPSAEELPEDLVEGLRALGYGD